ncbi:Histidine kinase [Rhodovastum atsumiense]|nr:hybrid sensor histidine kinase/response regulator [Rhodovastum atsumiense]CAH2602239.1 Histidine kinase [Rhodovastum atsumiense]
MMDLAVMVRDDGGIIRQWSDGCRRLYGWDALDAIGQPAHALLQTIFPVPSAGIEAALQSAGEWSGELRQRRRDGSEVIVAVHQVLQRDAAGGKAQVLESMTDITRQRLADTEARDNEIRLRLVQQVGGIAWSDHAYPDDQALVSEGFAVLYGLPQGQTHISDQAWLMLVHPDDRLRMAAIIERMLGHGGSTASEFRIQRADGSIRWVSMRAEAFLRQDGSPLRLITAQQDITEIMLARRTRFRGIFDSQFQFIGVMTDDSPGAEPAEATAPWNAGEATAAPPERMWQRLGQAAREVAGGRRDAPPEDAERRLLVDFSLRSVRDPGTGEISWVIAEGQNLAERHDLAERMAQAQTLQALGQLAGGIAHDLNNIFQTVSGAADLLTRRPGDPERTGRLARRVADAAARGSSVAQRLLSFARRVPGSTEAVETADMLAGIREILAHTLGQTIDVRAEVAAGAPRLVADRGQLETALVNLATNARDAMPDGGTLVLSAEPEQVVPGVPHPAGLAPGSYVRLSVADTGAGMDAATLLRASEPFFTTKLPGQGSGLGLTMVRRFAEEAGGAFLLSSRPGAGTTAVMWLRQAAERAGVAPVAGGTTEMTAPSQVMLVDDDDMVRETLAADLEDLGVATLAAAGGPEAIARLSAGEPVDAIVTDYSMQGMDGLAVIRKAQALRPGLPCFLLTGFADPRVALTDADAFTFVRKPVAGRDLAVRITAAVQKARASRHPEQASAHH